MLTNWYIIKNALDSLECTYNYVMGKNFPLQEKNPVYIVGCGYLFQPDGLKILNVPGIVWEIWVLLY